VVDVGAQVVGRIQELGKDPRAETDPAFKDKRIDYGSNVHDGTVLARIDPALYLATRNQAQASLDRAKADLLQAEAKLVQTEAEWKRAQRLRDIRLPSLASASASTGGAPSPSSVKGISDADFILARANFEVAQAYVEVGKAAVAQQQAMLDSAETNLGYTVIKSPVEGTIIDRRVNIGQTVVASLNAPSLFLIAKDLRRLEVWTAVNEADIGQLKVGMPVHFKVDAFPEDVFRGTVSQIRLNAQMTQNVVTYTVTITASNDDMKLLPYLSADVRFEIDERKGVLLVPNAALRYRPRPELIAQSSAAAAAPNASDQQSPGEVDSSSEPSGDSASGAAASAGDDERDRRTVWVREGNFVRPVEIEIGVTDGTHTEVVGGELDAGMQVVLSEDRAVSAVAETNNPFSPPRFRGGAKKKDSKS
jgi:HlyD family secretion protein